MQDIGNFEIINSIKEFYNDKKLLDVCAAPGGKSILLSTYQTAQRALLLISLHTSFKKDVTLSMKNPPSVSRQKTTSHGVYYY